MSNKKRPLPNRDNWTPLLIVVLDSKREAWRCAAARAEVSLTAWIGAELDKAAATRPVGE